MFMIELDHNIIYFISFLYWLTLLHRQTMNRAIFVRLCILNCSTVI